jgi:hypothetical protein
MTEVLTPLQERVLAALTDYDRPAGVIAAELVGVPGKALSGPLRALAKAGLAAERSYWPERGSTWRITEAGAAHIARWASGNGGSAT